MKVVYKKSMVEKLTAAVEEAKVLNRNIDHIVMSTDEWSGLVGELSGSIGFCVALAGQGDELVSRKFAGVKIVVEGDGEERT